MSSDKPQKPSTKIVTAGRRASLTGPVVNVPIWRASTHLYPDVAALEAGKASNEDGRFFYGRRGSPTQWSLAEALTEMEPGAQWLGLEIKDHRLTGADSAEVTFVARFRVAGRAVRQHERSRFVFEGGRWWYVDGDVR